MDKHPLEQLAHQLHQRLLQGDPLAPSELAEALLEELVRRLRRRVRYVQDETFLYDAATNALLDYVQHPSKFNPDKSSLLSYLTMAAHRDLLNMLNREKRRRLHEVNLLEGVEHDPSSGNRSIESIEVWWERYGFASPQEKDGLLRKVSEMFSDPQERNVLELMLSGERRTSAYSRVLGIEHLDPKEQQRTVKRHKDRIIKRLKRLGGKFREQR